jgi:hypothetical protein
MMKVEIAIACGSRSITQPPENDATDVEEIGMASRVAERAEPALGQPGDGATGAAVDRVQVVVDPRDHLLDVERLPLGLPAAAAVPPVGEPAAAVAVEAGVGHDDDQREPGRRRHGVAEVHPVGRATARTVKEVEHGIPALGVGVVAVGQQDSDVDGLLQRARTDADVELPRVELGGRDDVDAVGVAKPRRRGLRVQRNARGDRESAQDREESHVGSLQRAVRLPQRSAPHDAIRDAGRGL